MVTVRAADERPAEGTATPVAETGQSRAGVWVAAGMLVAGLLLFWAPLGGVDLDQVNGYGLVSVLPVPTFAGLALIVLSFMVSLAFARPRRWLLTLEILALLISLHYVAQSLESYARFPTAWQHAGLIEYIERNHGVDTGLDARLNTAGFFAFIAFVAKAIGQNNLEPFLHFAPPLTELFYLVPYLLILRVLRATWRAKWLAAWLFVVADWVGQDYLSPQGFAFLLYLYFVAILVNWFRYHDERTRRLGRRRTDDTAKPRTGPLWRVYEWIFRAKDPGELPAPEVDLRTKRVLLITLMLLVMVGAAAHQLTPYLMTATALGLVVVRRCSLRGLPIITGIVYAAWVSFMTAEFWAGHQSELFGGLGKLGANVSSSVGGRVANGDPLVGQVQDLRILLAVAIMGLAIGGLLRRRIRGIDDRVALVLLLVPFSTFGLQNYGGELALRVYFFMLPAACLLIAYLIFPQPFDAPVVRNPAVRIRFGWLRAGPRRHWPAVIAAGVLGMLLSYGFLTVRYSNEAFEQVHPDDVSAFAAVLKDSPAPASVNIVWTSAVDPLLTGGTPVMPWGYPDFERQNNVAVLPNPKNDYDITPILTAMRASGPHTYYVTTTSNEAYQVLESGLPVDLGRRIRAELAASPEIRVVYSSKYAAAYTLRDPPSEPVQPPHPSKGLGLRNSPWTPAGLIYLPVLLGVLIGRELRRLRLVPSQYRRLRPLTVLSIPLFLGVVAVIVERFIQIKQ